MASNANLNLNSLAARPVEYVADMCGDTGSTLHSGLETDCLIVEWRLTDPHVERVLARGQDAIPPSALDAPIVKPDAPTSTAPNWRGESLPTSPWVQVAVPRHIDEVKATAPDDARLWQLATRRAFQWYLTNGYRVERFQYVNDACHACYLLTRDASARPA